MRRTIAIVEDDENVSQLLAFAFQRDGFDTTVLRDGRLAVEHVLSSGPPDAVVLDLMLPCRDGFAVASAIRADPRWHAVPIVVLSARTARAEQERARAAGADVFVTKPFRPGPLVNLVKRVLARDAA